MKAVLKIGVLILALWMNAGNSCSQVLPGDVCRIENNRLIFKLNTDWNQAQLEDFSKTFNLDSTWMAEMSQGITSFTIGGVRWEIRPLGQGFLEVSKELSDDSNNASFFKNLFLMDDHFLRNRNQQKQAVLPFGKNSLKDNFLLNQDNELITVRLKGFQQAKSIYLSGTFNDWATTESPLTRTDEGWEIQLKLNPGKYFYKFIVDGRWTTDPNNNLTENENDSNSNSILFVYNHRFSLDSYSNAKKVILASSFNDFDENELLMSRNPIENSWFLDLYLPDGMHYYKFIVDGVWITDPDNPDQSPDGRGNINSAIGLGTAYTFVLKEYHGASQVELAGSFNNWNPGEIFLSKEADSWTVKYFLGPGTHTYKFIVDGEWIPDPENKNTIGTGNYVNSVLTIESNHEFRLNGYANASVVYVSGSFNDWSKEGYKMNKVDGKWIFPIHLSPGKYTYKFIVDKQWILDPNNDLWEENEHGTDNSVLWIN